VHTSTSGELGAGRRGLGYRHRPPSLTARASSALRSRRVAETFTPTVHPPFGELFARYGALDQGALNACTGFGVAMGATLQAAATGLQMPSALSPRLPYWAARRREAGDDDLVEDEGAFVDDVVWAFNAFGASATELTAENVNERPPPSAFRAGLVVRSALKLRLRAIVAQGARLVQRVAHSLHKSQVCFAALPVADTFLSPGSGAIPAQSLERALGYHFVCLLDWRHAFGSYELLCGNSWGTEWGERGTAWVSPELMGQSLGAWYLERIAP
jgi:hypothetical protein